jgi:hypothetical protein
MNTFSINYESLSAFQNIKKMIRKKRAALENDIFTKWCLYCDLDVRILKPPTAQGIVSVFLNNTHSK